MPFAYAFQCLNEKDERHYSGEKFEYVADLFASILEKGVAKQIKKGLFKEYIAIAVGSGTCFAFQKSDMNIGGIYLGQSIEDVIARTGEPFKIRPFSSKKSSYDFVKNGAKFSVIASDTVESVIVYDTATAPDLATAAGIKHGSSVEDVLKAYGKPWDDVKSPTSGPSGSRLITYRNIIKNGKEDQRFIFGFDKNDRVVFMQYIQADIFQ